ncbi:hypothetical protein LSM04_001870 [Trypanosoma melophagium]|uniref:uncharacterized protein n=1 Tax=Trypanosoma melophagium TaxID=715481 RepID=UPI00351A7C20|nr:hypothetical protein LSM04_001870 [Trypanosoma melophagium]
MWGSLFYFLLLFVALPVVAVEYCAEHHRQYRTAPGESSFNSINAAAAGCANGAPAAVAVLLPPPAPHLLLPTGGWEYLFGAVALGVLPETVNFTIAALCGELEVCRADVQYVIDTSSEADSSSTTTTTTTTTAAPLYPPCAASMAEYQLKVAPGKSTLGTLPTTAVQVVCHAGLKASITQPYVGLAALLDPNGMQFVYSSSSEDFEGNVTLPYQVTCGRQVVCAGAMQIWLHEDAVPCLESNILYDVKPGSVLNATLNTGASCNGVLKGRIRSQSVLDAFKFYDGVSFTFNAPENEGDAVVNVRVYCDDESLCDTTIGFIITNEPRPSSSEAPTPETSQVPTTPPLVICNKEFNFTVPTRKQLRNSLFVELQNCSVVTYNLSSIEYAKRFQINLIGDFHYFAPEEETIDIIPVDVLCKTEFRCRTQVTITSYLDVTNTESPTTPPATPAPIPSCANVYYYRTAPGVAISNSLSGMPGQDPCAHGRYFSLINLPKEGTLDITPIGDFIYRPERLEGSQSFSFNMYCLNKLFCKGNAYILVSNEYTLPPNNNEHASSSTEPPTNEVTNPQIKCRGTCNEKAWKTYPKPALWDNTPGAGYARRDGRAVDGLQVAWSNNSIIITVYTIIGNLGVRFPTFEPFDRMVGKYFEPMDFEGVVSPDSLGFELSCLQHQGTIGMGEDVWHWKTLGNGTGTGTVGPLYNKGNSWYQKFGGKHIGCDTFVDSCHYAPLLTPAKPKGTLAGRWEIDIDDCDATWTGTFPYALLDQLRKSDGSPVWYFVGDRQIKGTVISQGVRANSWIEPARSFDSHYESHDIIFTLQQFIVVNKITSAPFSIDSEFFEFTENGNRAFGVNLLLYPYVTDDMETSYAEDRHVVGFKWITQDWIAPSVEQCPTCQGNKTVCRDEGKYATSTYIGEFPSGDCRSGTPRIELRKGPSMNNTCPPNKMHVYNRSGFSKPSRCATSFQNITIRGVAIGSNALSNSLQRAFNYEGRVVLQLLMADGTKHDLAMDLSMYVARLSQDSYAAEGGLSVCRGSDYWPVLDPLGTSLPDSPFEFSTATRGPLCIDSLSSTFGPSGWATVFLQLPGVNTSQVNVHSISLRYNETTVYLFYQDSVTGVPVVPPRSLGYWWMYTHPFLNFRDLKSRVTNGTISTGPAVSPEEVANVPFAFAFIPGAINIATNVEVIVKATITAGIVSTSTFSHMMHVDPMMTQRSRYGPPVRRDTDTSGSNKKDVLGIGAIAGLSVALTITVVVYMTMDNNRPLPTWVPRGKLIKNTVLAAVPAGLRLTKKEKRIVHKDMYDAMKSGRY